MGLGKRLTFTAWLAEDSAVHAGPAIEPGIGLPVVASSRWSETECIAETVLISSPM